MEESNRGLGIFKVKSSGRHVAGSFWRKYIRQNHPRRHFGKSFQRKRTGKNHLGRHFERTHRRWLTAALITVGLVLLLYPWISNYVYENRVKSEIETYEEEMEENGAEDNERLYQAAQAYNEQLYDEQSGGSRLTDPFSEAAVRKWTEVSPLSGITESGAIGYIEIPAISVYLPVFEGTAAETLLAGIGLLEGSSLPVGGESTHAVLTGHSGLSSAKMFTDLTELQEGNCFYFHILGETLAYVVTEITVVEPDDTQLLMIREGKDLMTLVTCTPYGVNTHRLYVTGERTSYTQETCEAAKAESKIAQSAWMTEYRKAVILGIIGVAAAAVLWSVAEMVYRRIHSGTRN